MRRLLDWVKSAHPAFLALVVVVFVTWQIAISLFVGLIRSDQTVLDGTAFTLLSAVVASWTGLGIWAGRKDQRPYMGIAITALAGIAFITGCSLMWEAFMNDESLAIPSNVAQLIILVVSALVSIVGASIGYSSYGGDPPPPDEPPEEE